GELLEDALGEELFSHGIWAGRRIVEPTRDAALEHPLLDALAVGALVSVEAISAAGWREVPASGFRLWRNDEALPRVRLAPGGRGVAREEVDAALRAGGFDPRADVFWPGDGLVLGEIGPHDEVEVFVDSWNELAVRTISSKSAMLVVADSWAPGWRATIDGAPAEILRVWGVVRGVAVPEGLHEVVFRFEPPGLRLGIAMSLAGLLLAGTALTAGARRGTL
ncbi:MAG: YfhO family protein, partial [bacterium]